MKNAAFLLTLTASVSSACSPSGTKNVVKDEDLIVVRASSDASADAYKSRWFIEIFNGPGIDGPDADLFLTDADTRLIEIVQECRLGVTYRMQHTDGVLMLAIQNPQLSAEKLNCIRSKERPGLRLIDKGPQK